MSESKDFGCDNAYDKPWPTTTPTPTPRSEYNYSIYRDKWNAGLISNLEFSDAIFEHGKAIEQELSIEQEQHNRTIALAMKRADELSAAQATITELTKDKERLEQWLVDELGIEKALPNAGDDETKDYWIGVDNQCYESLRTAIDQARNKKS